VNEGAIRCPECGARLGEVVDGKVISRHRDRVYLAPQAIACDRRGCFGIWRDAGAGNAIAYLLS
jgi:hypothetical protein